MEITTREAGELLAVTPARVRALIAADTLRARRVGTQWLIDIDSVEQQAALTSAQARGRGMAPRVAWAVGDLVDGGGAQWLSAAERSRLRKRVKGVTKVEVVQKWLRSRSTRVTRCRIGVSDIEALLAEQGVVRTGVSAASAYGLGLGGGASADAYVTKDFEERLTRDFFLIESRTGNLTLRVVDHDLHLRTGRCVDAQVVAPRVMVAVDLAADTDARTRSLGRSLLEAVLTEFRAAES
ncbi:helix-turn-helix domain-containing protein [Ornithinimicrobium ciconiae]|uniref:Helix-turn-helix domain-containing protein n=1 Tax=Ornithinimicrobium ciconiae TaxID=2594265 RepID=A0A516GDH6_9MICO|nr:helix-turn-helix domain-containing protein [Ornithinimicrobium ciconiae]QDO89572.1 helix-turn-helix domain-containing protein [Ornithinimicrobium ciconiae]